MNLEGGSSTMDFERRMKGALRMERFSLKRLSSEDLWGGFICWRPWKIVKKSSGYGQLSP